MRVDFQNCRKENADSVCLAARWGGLCGEWQCSTYPLFLMTARGGVEHLDASLRTQCRSSICGIEKKEEKKEISDRNQMGNE